VVQGVVGQTASGAICAAAANWGLGFAAFGVSAVATRQRLEASSAAEEDLMLRVPLSKQEAKKHKMQFRWGFLDDC
jgi:hypothetical protein